eukprot:UN01743
MQLTNPMDYNKDKPEQIPYANITCYYSKDGKPLRLVTAYAAQRIYNDNDDINNISSSTTTTTTNNNNVHLDNIKQRLYVQLPETPRGVPINLRCEMPLPIFTPLYDAARITYYLQSGTVLETHAVDMVSKYYKTKFYSDLDIIQQTKTPTILNKKLESLPQAHSKTARNVVNKFTRAGQDEVSYIELLNGN